VGARQRATSRRPNGRAPLGQLGPRDEAAENELENEGGFARGRALNFLPARGLISTPLMPAIGDDVSRRPARRDRDPSNVRLVSGREEQLDDAPARFVDDFHAQENRRGVLPDDLTEDIECRAPGGSVVRQVLAPIVFPGAVEVVARHWW